MVLIFSGAANKSQQVLREVAREISKNVIIIPFRIENVLPTGSMEYFLYSTHWLDAFTSDLEKHINELLQIIETILSRPSEKIDVNVKLHLQEKSSKGTDNKKLTIFGSVLCLLLVGILAILAKEYSEWP